MRNLTLNFATGCWAYSASLSSCLTHASRIIAHAYGIRERAGTQDIAMEHDLRLANADPVLAAEQRTAATCVAQNYGVRIRPTTIGVKFTKDFCY